MAYSKSLAARLRQTLGKRQAIVEKKMFGSVVFLLNGKMLVGIWQNSLIARLGPEQAAAALERPDVVQFDITGRPMKNWVMIEPDGVESDRQLSEWIEQATRFVATLPPKPAKE